MKIRYTGSPVVRRTIGPYTWAQENSHVVDVDDVPLCANLLTCGEFKLAVDEPMFEVCDENDIIALAMAGVGNLAALAALEKKSISDLAEFTGLDVSQIKAWIKRANQLMEVNHEQ